jgi:hypothetical protein
MGKTLVLVSICMLVFGNYGITFIARVGSTIDFIGWANDLIVELYNSGSNSYESRWLYLGNNYYAWQR